MSVRQECQALRLSVLSFKNIRNGATVLTLRDVSAWLLVRLRLLLPQCRLTIRWLWGRLMRSGCRRLASPAWLPALNTAAKIYSLPAPRAGFERAPYCLGAIRRLTL